MSNDERISSALSLLEEAVRELSSQPPAMVVMAPYSASSIIGNKGGFVHLAIAALKASSGEEQSFRKQAWATVEDLDWTVDGLKYDPDAHIYLPEEHKRNIWQRGIGYLLPACVAICLLVGLVTIVRFVFHIR